MATETLDTLLLGTGVDLAGLTAGLASASRLLDSFASDLNLGRTGGSLADDLVDTMAAQLSRRRGDLGAEVAASLADTSAIAAAAQDAAAQFAGGLQKSLATGGIGELASGALGKDIDAAFASIGQSAGATLAAAIENTVSRGADLATAAQAATASANAVAGASAANASLAAAARAADTPLASMATSLGETATAAQAATRGMAGIAASTAQLGESTEAAAQQTGRLSTFVAANGEEFTRAGHRGVEAILGISLALSAVATDSDNAASKVQSVLQTVAGFGLLLGKNGLIVSAAATALEEIVSLITETDKRLRTEATSIRTLVAGLADQHTLTAFTDKIQQLDTEILLTARDLEGVHLPTLDLNTDTGISAALATAQRQLDELQKTEKLGLADPFDTGLFDKKGLGEDIDALKQIIANLKAVQTLTAEAKRGPVTTQVTDASGTSGLGPLSITAGPETPTKDVQDLLASLQSLNALAPSVTERLKGIAVPGLLPLTQQGLDLANVIDNKAVSAFDVLTQKLADQHGAINANTAAIEQELDALGKFPAVQTLRLKPIALSTEQLELTVDQLKLPPLPPIPVKIEPTFAGFNPQDFKDLAQQLADLQARAAALAAAGDTSDAAVARAQALRQTQMIADAERDVLSGLKATGAPADALVEVMTEIDAILKKSGVDTSRLDALLQGLTKNQVVQDFETLGQDISSLNSVLGDTATKAGNAFTSIGQLIDAFHVLQGEARVGIFDFGSLVGGATSLIGAIGAVGSLFGGIFAESPTQKEHDAITKQNTEALEQLRDSLNSFAKTGSSLNQVISVLSGLHLLGRNGIDALSSSALTAQQAMDELRSELKGTGVSLAELQAIAKDNGIQLLDSKGHLVAGALDDLLKALGIAEQQILKVGTDFQSQLDLQQLIDKAAGVSSPALDFSDAAAEFKNQAQFAFTDFFGNLGGADFAHLTAQQIAEFRKDIENLLKAIQAGTISLTELGNFTDVTQLEQAASTWLDALNAMGDAADSVTQSLLNVPTGFKLALAEFNATTPADLQPPSLGGTQLPMLPPIQTTPVGIGIDDPAVGKFFLEAADRGMPIDDRSIASMADRLADAIRGASGAGGFRTGDITIVAGDRDAEQLADDILTVFQRRARTGLPVLAGVLP